MNKKKLSVVMAGAMLASSVAPVLAAETTADKKYEVSANDLGVVKSELRTFLNSKKFHMTDTQFADKSVYYFTTDLNNTPVRDVDTDSNNTIANLKAGQKLYVWSEGFAADEKGNYFSTKKTGDSTKLGKYTLDTMKSAVNWFENNKATAVVIQGMSVDESAKELKVQLKNGTVLTYTTNDYEVDFVKPTFNGYSINNAEANIPYVDGFEAKPATSGSVKVEDLENTLLAEVTITPGGYDIALDDIYDGLMLTTDGHDFFTLLKEAQSMGRTVNIRGNNTSKPWIKYNGKSYESNIANAIEMKAGKGYFTVEIGAKGQLAAETYTITGTNKANLERIAGWMIKPQARVDILAGDNRYETAVEIAKEYAELTGETVSNNGLSADIVLVNGNALVDGLAAAPLASALGLNAQGTESTKHRAPVLLTEADALPKATKAYLKEVLANVKIGKLGTATIHLVGGESVLNKSLERELKSLGFKVERYGGDNREETSLKVAEAIEGLAGTNADEAFVVGAEGEADAMSIASVAANTKTPIIVAKKGGITEDATYELRGKKATIIGGENAVSKADYNAIKAEASGIARIAGSNRQATNAEIIAKYYKNGFVGAAKNVVVAKDGQNNKSELVDALAAANMASEKKAPIVLATNKLSKAQINALELNAKNSYALYQVGHGVARDVVKAIAENLGLSNR